MEIQLVPLDAVWAMRHTVMYPAETLDFVKLEKDTEGAHWGICEEGQLVSVISVFEEGKDVQFRKFATRTDKQGQGYGSTLLQYIMDQAVAAGKERIWCNSRLSATGIYKKFGMQPAGQPWQQHGLDFIIMEKAL